MRYTAVNMLFHFWLFNVELKLPFVNVLFLLHNILLLLFSSAFNIVTFC